MPGFLLALLAIYNAIFATAEYDFSDIPPEKELYESLIGGVETSRNLYPEMVYLVNDRGGRCSGALIGPRVVLTAAHCTRQGGKIRNYFSSSGFVEFEATCNVTNPWIAGRIDYDFALCKSNKPIVGAKPATLGRVPLKKGSKITMAGFGCTSSDAQGGNNGILKTGPTSVAIEATNTYNYLYSFNQPILCFGDSGGPLYRLITDPVNQRHVIFGVNSRTNLISLSVFASTYTKPVHRYITWWAKKERVGICGINIKCKIAGLSVKKSNVTFEQVEDHDYDADDEDDDV